MSTKRWYVYLITNTVNGKVYVGKAADVQNRWRVHCRRAKLNYRSAIYSAIQKYGRDKFRLEILSSHHTEALAFAAERREIRDRRSNVPRVGYNMTEGGDGASGHRPGADTRRKISEATRARYAAGWRMPVAAVARIAAANRGKKKSRLARERMRAASLGRIRSQEARAAVGLGSSRVWAERRAGLRPPMTPSIAPYGYRIVNKKLAEDRREQAIIRIARRLRFAGVGPAEISAHLAVEGLFARDGRPFRRYQLEKMYRGMGAPRPDVSREARAKMSSARKGRRTPSQMKLSDKDVLRIRTLAASGMVVARIASQYPVHPSLVYRIVRGKCRLLSDETS